MRRGDDTGDGGRVEGEAIRSKKVRGICDIESAPTVLAPVKEMLSVSVERCRGRERENWLCGQGGSAGRTGEGKAA